MASVAELTRYIAPIVERAGFVLEEITITPAGKRRLLTVFIDGEDRNLSLDEVTSVSKQISEVVEVLPELGDKAFTLEVTSPGVDRPLTVDRHWRKNIGRLVKITTNDKQSINGRIKSYSTEEVVITLPKTEVVVLRGDIKRAIIEIEFNRKEKDGAK